MEDVPQEDVPLIRHRITVSSLYIRIIHQEIHWCGEDSLDLSGHLGSSGACPKAILLVGLVPGACSLRPSQHQLQIIFSVKAICTGIDWFSLARLPCLYFSVHCFVSFHIVPAKGSLYSQLSNCLAPFMSFRQLVNYQFSQVPSHSHSSARFVHNSKKKQLYTYLGSEGHLVPPSSGTEFHQVYL